VWKYGYLYAIIWFFFFIEYCYDYARKVKLCDNLVMFMFIMLLFLFWSWPFVKFVFNSIQELFVFVFFRASHLWFKLDAWGGRFQKSVGRNNVCFARVVIIIMNQKFGGGRQPTGTPSLARLCVVFVTARFFFFFFYTYIKRVIAVARLRVAQPTYGTCPITCTW